MIDIEYYDGNQVRKELCESIDEFEKKFGFNGYDLPYDMLRKLERRIIEEASIPEHHISDWWMLETDGEGISKHMIDIVVK